MVGVDLLPEGAKGLVFDCDGTLIDSMEQLYIAWKATCDKFGLNEFTPKLIVENAGVPINDLFAIVLKLADCLTLFSLCHPPSTVPEP